MNAERFLIASVICALGFAVNAGESKIAPLLQKSLSYKEGKIGQAVEMGKQSRLVFKTDRINADGGTIECLVNLKTPAVKGAFTYLFSVGNNNPVWFLIGADDNGLSFMFRKKGSGGKYEFYASTKSKTQINAGEWTHLTFIWGFKKEKECILQIYINGKVVDEKFDQTIGTQWGKNDEIFGIGCSSAGSTAPAFDGMFDELRVSNYPKAPSAIKTAYQDIQAGKAPELDKGTLLLLHFDGSAEGLASDDAGIIAPEEMIKISEKVMNEIYPQ
jgi:hypothetical protein